MTSNSSPGRWHILAGLLALSLISAGAVGVDTVSPDGPSFRSVESTTSVSADTQHIALEEGWNLISSRLVPDDPSMDAVFAPVAGAVEVVKDPSGAVYRPSDGTNAIGDWDVHESYEVYTTSPQTLVIEGSPPVPSESEIPLQEGWNAISYLPPTTKPLTEAFASIDGALVMAKDETGDAFVPGEGITQLESLTPGEGYKIRVASSTTLEYPLDEETLFTYDSQCEGQSDAYLAHEHGDLAEGSLDISVDVDSLKIIENTNTINAAIDAAGQNGGGTVCLPKGRYELASPYVTDPNPPDRVVSISVDHDNITVWGAGRNDDGNGTGLFTNGKYYVVDGSVRRGHGMRVETGNANVTLRDFELNGQGALPGDSTAYTGDDSYPADPATGDGWDTSHKGLIVGWGAGTVTDLLVENVAVRSYKGEMIYQGGISARDQTYRNIISEDTNAQTWNVHGDNIRVEDSYFGLSTHWAELEMLWGEGGDQNTNFVQDTSGVWVNNTFENYQGSQGIAFAQGDNSEVPYRFENNTFRNCNFEDADESGSVLGVAEASGGPILFENNTLEDCAPIRPIVGGGQYDGALANVFIEDNQITDVKGRMLHFWRGLKNWEIRNNYFEGDPDNIPTLARLGGGRHEVLIEDNEFVNAGGINRTTDQALVPLWQNNEGTGETRNFVDPGEALLPVVSTLQACPPRDGSEQDAILETDRYQDGHSVTIRNCSFSTGDNRNDLVFTTTAATYNVPEQIVVTQDAQNTITLEFDGPNDIWEYVDHTE